MHTHRIKLCIWLTIIVGLHIVVIVLPSFRHYEDKAKMISNSYAAAVAKASAQQLKPSIMFLLLFGNRRTLTRLSFTSLKYILIPVDYIMTIHKVLGYYAFVMIWIHSICHIIQIIHYVHAPPDIQHEAWPGRPLADAKTLFTSLAAVTGYVMLGLTMIAYTFIFYKKNYDLFYLTHHLLIIMVIISFFHPMPKLPTSEPGWGHNEIWFWVMFPLFVYLIERSVRVISTLLNTSLLKLTDVHIAENYVLIKAEKPFHFKPGMFAFLNCPKISYFQWHPFSICSSPKDDTLEFAVHNKGDWTKQFMEIQEPIYIYGPFGSPLQNYKKYSNMLLIATGAGITPFMSFLKDTDSSITLVWVIGIKSHLNLLYPIILTCSHINFIIHITRETIPEKNLDHVTFVQGRPNWEKVLELEYECVLYCGNLILRDKIKKLCKKTFISESF